MIRDSQVPDQVRTTLRRALGFRDLLFFYIVTTFSLRWIATAAAAGPSALVIWIIAAVGLFVPLVFATLELSSRYPEEGGIYVWSKRAFGPFPAFLAAGHAGPRTCRNRRCYRFAAAICSLSADVVAGVVVEQRLFHDRSIDRPDVAVSVNVVGLDIGKWLNNAGGISAWIVAGLLILLAPCRGPVSDRRHHQRRR
jgi:hypothetical protein